MQQAQIIPYPGLIGYPCCEVCDAPMFLISIEPDKPGCDRRTFECRRCKHVTVEVVKYK
jgi:hypothetical protein